MNSMRYLSFFFVLSAVIYSGCSGVSTDSYTGDGKITKIGKWPLSHGYLISFGNITFNDLIDNSYTIENFPNIGSTFYFGIIVTADEQVLSSIVKGKLRMSVRSENESTFFDINEDMSEWTFSESYISKEKVSSFIYYMDGPIGSYIEAEKLKDIRKLLFSVELVGMEENPPVIGEIVMKVGGHK